MVRLPSSLFEVWNLEMDPFEKISFQRTPYSNAGLGWACDFRKIRLMTLLVNNFNSGTISPSHKEGRFTCDPRTSLFTTYEPMIYGEFNVCLQDETELSTMGHRTTWSWSLFGG